MQGRIFFEGSPWPEGHAVAEVEFSANLSEKGVSLNLHLGTEDYFLARDIKTEDEDGVPLPEYGDLPAWEHPSVWYNYHACKISNTFWSSGPSPIMLSKPGERFSIKDLSGRVFKIDPVPKLEDGRADPEFHWEHDDLHFHTYLLGHDAVADHEISFKQIKDGLFDIDWSGRVAMAYVGDYDFRYKFRAQLKDVPFLGFACARMEGENVSDHIYPDPEMRRKTQTQWAEKWLADVDTLNYIERAEQFECDLFSPSDKWVKFWV